MPPPERTGILKIGPFPVTVVGDDVQVGQPAPAFHAQVGAWHGIRPWKIIEPLARTAGKVRILATVPSLDTEVCDMEMRRFNTAATTLSDYIQIITVSVDLPAAQRRWCGAAGAERVVAVSDHIDVDCAIKYGTLIKEQREHRRAVFVIDPQDIVRYVAYMPNLDDQPDYAAVLAAAVALVA